MLISRSNQVEIIHHRQNFHRSISSQGNESENVGNTEHIQTNSRRKYDSLQEKAQNNRADISLDGLVLKNNTNQKKSIFSEFSKNNSDVKIIKKSEPPQAKKKNYSTSSDWREELKNRDKAKQIEAMGGYTMRMPGYKEPE